MKTGLLYSGLVLVILSLVAEPAGAQGGITVSGTGELSAKPNLVEIDLRAIGRAELTGDAIVKFQNSKRRLFKAFQDLNKKNLEIEELGFSVKSGNSREQMMLAPQAQGVKAKSNVEFSRSIRVRLRGVQDIPEEKLMTEIGKLLDVAKDLGTGIGPSASQATMAFRFGIGDDESDGGSVKFVLTDFEKLRERAYQAAVDDARRRAGRLAKLNDVTLGAVLSVREVEVAGENVTGDLSGYYYAAAMASAPKKKGLRIESGSFQEIPVRVRLMIRFAIQPAEIKKPPQS